MNTGEFRPKLLYPFNPIPNPLPNPVSNPKINPKTYPNVNNSTPKALTQPKPYSYKPYAPKPKV